MEKFGLQAVVEEELFQVHINAQSVEKGEAELVQIQCFGMFQQLLYHTPVVVQAVKGLMISTQETVVQGYV